MWRGVGLAPGDIYSGRAEAFGMLAALIFLQHYVNSYGPLRFSGSTVQCYCDNLGLITTLNEMKTMTTTYPNDTTKDDQDIYLEITTTARRCEPIDLQFHHIQGHQDTKANCPLTIPEQLNVECNKKAKQYVMTTPTKSTNYGNPAMPAAQPHLRIGGKIICRKLHHRLKTQITTPAYYAYLREKFEWTSHDLTHIHWKVLGNSLDSFNPNDQRRLVLFINGKLPLCASKAHPHLGSNLCPSCQREPEDKRHFLQCAHHERTANFAALKTNLMTLMQKLGLHPCIVTSLWLGLRTTRHGSNYPDVIQDHPQPLKGVIQIRLN